MRNRKLLFGLLVITLIIGMTGCGRKNQNQSNAETPVPSETVTEATTDRTIDDTTDEVMAQTTVEETVEEETKEEVTEEEQDMTSTVINNNGHFVQVGDKIYFHIADADSMGKTALWAQFADQESGRTVLFEYDPKQNEAKNIAFDFTSGGISVQGEVLYTLGYKDNLKQPDEPEVALGSYTKENGFKTIDLIAPSDSLLGAGLNDSFLAALHYAYVDNKEINQILIYVDGVLQNTFDVDHFRDLVFLGDNTIFFISGEPETGFNLTQMDVISGETIDLGVLPGFDYSDWNGSIDEVIYDGTQIYFTYSSYEGTGHFFSQGFFVQAKAGVKDSVSFTDMPTCMVDGDPRAAKFAVKDGQMVVCEGETGTCEVKGNGVLGYYDDQGEWVEVADGWDSVFFDQEGNYKGVELAEKVGDYIFLIFNDNARVPEDDIGWRYAYCRNYTDVYRISIKTGESKRLVHQVAPWGE